ncbi:hypothetical protein N7466_004937 [Penicillium verhagenii]|uniref:uncharacterized protein n=1 Tax=Penicillium verhagenii TaxID=1562060 RepID=UPI002545B1BA|nr:uncharacterized protein N7466_004937 [Penicillium verhagenii]KAJ5935390.1 hypothetical protein N7466_004937 [Penicillium verhagenii]
MYYNITGTHSPPFLSSSDVLGPLNFSIASRSSSSQTSTPLFDFTSFTTDNFQQPWLPTPPHTQPSASSLNNNSNNNNNNNSALEDFVLYPAPQARQQPRFRDSRSLAPNTTLRPSALQPFLAQNNPRRHSFSLQLQRHLQQQFPGSPIQDPRVTQLARSPSYWSHPVKHSPLHSATVPNNSPQRSPIPPFYAGNITPEKRKQYMQYRRNMSAPNFQGNFFHLNNHIHTSAHIIPSDQDAELFGLPSAGGMGLTFDDFLRQETSALSPEAPAGTISPQDLMFDHSIPPSGTFTDLSTPPFDSPAGTFSQNPSPMFADVEFMGNDEWPPLFHDGAVGNAIPSGLFDTPEFASALAEPKKQMQPSIEMSPASKPLTISTGYKSSPVSAPMSATGTTRHSSVAGISRQRKDLSPIEFDPNDPVATKRARNTEAARKSRAKKLARQNSAETRIQALEDQISERDERIANLEAQLAILRGSQ